MREIVKDFDFIILIVEFYVVCEQLVLLLNVKDIIVNGDIKVLVMLVYEYDVFVDFCFVEDKVFVIMFYYFIGLKDYNVCMC